MPISPRAQLHHTFTLEHDESFPGSIPHSSQTSYNVFRTAQTTPRDTPTSALDDIGKVLSRMVAPRAVNRWNSAVCSDGSLVFQHPRRL